MGKIGVILSNIGTPDSPSPKDVGNYLNDFLMDPFVIDKPWLFRALLVKGIIVPFRSKTSSQSYHKIWESEGSPLLIKTKALQKKLQLSIGDNYKIAIGMRYGKPSLESAFNELKDCERIILFPQFPQYAESSVRTCVEWCHKNIHQEFRTIDPFFEHSLFIEAWCDNIQKHLSGFSFDHVLFSYHGLPEKHLKKIDPTGKHCGNYPECCENSQSTIKTCYRAQCLVTTQEVTKKLGFKAEQFSMSFQSRLGREPWIPPFTDHLLRDLPGRGVKRLAVVCPSFTVDCLETLEEIAMTGREMFLGSGGEEFKFIPCLNAEPPWVKACVQMILDR